MPDTTILILSIILAVTVLIIIGLIAVIFVLISKNRQESNIDTSNFEKTIQKEFSDLKTENMNQLFNLSEKLNAKFQQNNQELQGFKDSSTAAINNSYTNLLTVVNDQLKEMNKRMDERIESGFKTNTDSLEKVNNALGSITTAQKNLDVLKDEVINLNKILSNSQERGRFGEVALESILSEVFGDTHNLYHLQYKLSEEAKPDAVIVLPEPHNLLCIDSKFSFVSYSKLFDNVDEKDEKELRKKFKEELKKQIQKISSTYILKNKTTDYAIMFIPNEGIYNFINSDAEFYDQIITYARKQKVILASPGSLQPILSNVRTLQVNYEINKNVKNVIKEIYSLQEETNRLEERWTAFSNSISTIQKKHGELNTTVEKIVKKTNHIVEESATKNLED